MRVGSHQAQGLLILLGGWITLAITMGPDLAALWRLQQSARTTDGVVRAVDPQQHRHVTFTYVVGETTYTGTETASYRIGDRVTVYYAPRRPEDASLSEPAKLFRANLIGAAILGLLVPIVAQVVVARAASRAHRADSATP